MVAFKILRWSVGYTTESATGDVVYNVTWHFQGPSISSQYVLEFIDLSIS